MVLVRKATLQDWRALRGIRLTALRDAPDAFGSTYAEQAALPPEYWQRLAANGAMFLAFLPGQADPLSQADPVGLAGGYSEEPGVAEIVSMFVRPGARGQGVGEALIDAVAGWAADNGLATLHLWVTDTNGPAIALYERCGFKPTGERQPLPSNPALDEIAMTRPQALA
jgi:GNAT superfamily N-acetyltransferase